MNPISTSDGVVDQVLGSAYQVVKYVASNMETLINMASTSEELKEIMAQLQIVFDNMDSIVAVDTDIDNVNAVSEHLAEIAVLAANITALINTSTNIAAVNDVHDNMAALLDLQAHLNDLVNILPLVDVTRESIRRTYAESGYVLVPGSCELGATLTGAGDVVLYSENGEAYGYVGAYPPGGYVVTPGTNPTLPGSGLVSRAAITLRGQLAGPNGATVIGKGDLKVDNFIGDKVICRPAGNPAGDLAALLDAEATGLEVVTLKGDEFILNNSAGPGVTFTSDDFVLSGFGKIKGTHDTNDLVLTTGKRARVGNGIKLEGPGTWRPDLGSTGNPPALLKMVGEDSLCKGALLIEPYCAGIYINQAVGCKQIKNTILCSYAGSIALPFIFGIYLRVAADVTTHMNTIDGCIQGICGGGDGSGTLSVVCKDGVTTSNLRNVTAHFNTCVNQLDHSIYFTNNTENINILYNPWLESANDIIKIEGGPNQVIGNTGKGGSGITGRNVHSTRISGNILTTTLSSEYAYGILLYEQAFKRNIFDVEIDSNQLTHIGVESKGAIYVIGDVWADQSFQSVASSISIHHNKARGYGNAVEGFQIGVKQTLLATNPVTGINASGIHVDYNDCAFGAHEHTSTIGIDLGRGIVGGSAIGNHLKGFRNMGIRKQGVQNFTTTNNAFEAAAGSTPLAGVYERPKDTAAHIDSKNNKYGDNTFIGTFSREIMHSDETCTNTDRKIIRRTGSGLTSDTIIASQWPRQVIYTNHATGALITIDALTSSPWPKDTDLTITNAHATNTLTVNPGGFVVAGGTSLRLVSTGSNTWIPAK